MWKLLLRNDLVAVVPGAAPWGAPAVWMGRQHRAAWWPGYGPWPEGCVPTGDVPDNRSSVDQVAVSFWEHRRTRRRPPTRVVFRRQDIDALFGFRRKVTIDPCSEEVAELRFPLGPTAATLATELRFQAVWRTSRVQGRKQAQGVFPTLMPGAPDPKAGIPGKDGRGEELPFPGELMVKPVALPHWLWWAGYRDDVNQLIQPPDGGWALWWGKPQCCFAGRSWVDVRGTVGRYRLRCGAQPASASPETAV